ncbi:MAG: hypothetical protein L0Y72_20055 [Gemmataceae bacterium]|nr:hypothetical protein [Gemmataceae bacterium]MCI0741331.1 hypothetical protein [Gemmataceae bacterium]
MPTTETTTAPHGAPLLAAVPLDAGVQLTRAEFERRYGAMPALKKAELIEGVVFLPSPTRLRAHGRPSRHLSTWMGVYEAATPGVIGADNTTTRPPRSGQRTAAGWLTVHRP